MKRMRSTSSFGLLGLGSPKKPKLLAPPPPDASPKVLLQELIKATEVLLKLDAVDVAEELTRQQAALYLAIEPRDWLRHYLRKRPDSDIELSVPPPEDNVDRFNKHFNRTGEWAKSLILAPDGYDQRAKVSIKLIAVCLALRRLNNYSACHALMNGIGNMLREGGDPFVDRVSPCADWKGFRSLELLFSVYGGYGRYRLALRNSSGPVIPDMSVHGPETGRIKVVPDYRSNDPVTLNWGKYILLGKLIRTLVTYQKRFEDLDSHDFEPRPVIDALFNNAPLMDDEQIHQRSVDAIKAQSAVDRVRKFLGLASANRQQANTHTSAYT